MGVLDADLVLLDGKVVTVDSDDSVVEAVAVRDGRIVAVGDNSSVMGLAGVDTRILNLAGRTVLPGIIDSHTHPSGAAVRFLEIDCRSPPVESIGEILEMVAARAENVGSTRAPSHGPIHRNPERILVAYENWTSGATVEKALVVYVSMWGSTEKMAKHIAETLAVNGVEAPLYNLTHADIGDIARELVDVMGVVLGTPTVLLKMHSLAVYAFHLVTILKPPLKYGAVVSSYGWSKGALTHASEVLGPTGLEVVGALEINGPPGPEDYLGPTKIGEEPAKKILAG